MSGKFDKKGFISCQHLMCFLVLVNCIAVSLIASRHYHLADLYPSHDNGMETWRKRVQFENLQKDKHGNNTNNNQYVTDGGSCLVRGFQERLQMGADLSEALLAQIQSCKIVIFMRTPKVGSRTVRDVFYELGKLHNYTGLSSYLSKTKGRLSKEIPHICRMLNDSRPAIMTKHLLYQEYDCKRGEPALVNVIRHPINHTISVYYYTKYCFDMQHRDRRHPNKVVDKTYNQTLEQCLDRRGLTEPCFQDSITALQYFCGYDPICSDRRSSERLPRAKANLGRYLLVGLTEDLPAFFQVLETFIPRLFQNASMVYNKMRSESLVKWKTVGKDPLSAKMQEKLKIWLAPDIELYQLAKARFYQTLSKVSHHTH